MTMGHTIKHYRLPQKIVTPGFRAMEQRDISAVAGLLEQYLLQFVVAPELSEADVEHWLVPLNNVVNTFVIEDVDSHTITAVCSFYTLPSSVLGDQTPEAYNFKGCLLVLQCGNKNSSSSTGE
ncbi:hypothetical protein L7F22_048797 [Adiantum nelumboides]|nr:hypothetical protein [Adiantum nelumboides]